MAKTNIGTLATKLGASFRKDENYRFTYDKFDSRPLFVDEDGDGAPTGATGDVNIMATPVAHYEYSILGEGQTLVKPAWSASGIDVALDLVNNEGMELTQGISAVSKARFVVGTDEFYARCKFTIADVSGTDDCAFGFRKLEAYNATIDNYDEMAALNVISGDIKIETILNNGATTTTDTTNNWADTETHTLEVRVSKSGAVNYLIDGVAPLATAAFTFDAAEVVIPFFHFLHDATSPGAINIKEWENGLFSSRGLYGASDLEN